MKLKLLFALAEMYDLDVWMDAKLEGSRKICLYWKVWSTIDWEELKEGSGCRWRSYSGSLFLAYWSPWPMTLAGVTPPFLFLLVCAGSAMLSYHGAFEWSIVRANLGTTCSLQLENPWRAEMASSFLARSSAWVIFRFWYEETLESVSVFRHTFAIKLWVYLFNLVALGSDCAFPFEMSRNCFSSKDCNLLWETCLDQWYSFYCKISLLAPCIRCELQRSVEERNLRS